MTIVTDSLEEVERTALETTVRDDAEGKTVQYALEEPIRYEGNVQQIPRDPVTQQELNQTGNDAVSWLLYGGGYRQQRFTTADVITPENVGNLSLEYTYHAATGQQIEQGGTPTGDGQGTQTPGQGTPGGGDQSPTGIEYPSMEGTPIVVPGDPPIMYQTNGPDVVRAVNARNGETLWVFNYQQKDGYPALLCCGENNRGVGVKGDTVFMSTLDANVVALNRYTGEQRWIYDSAPTDEGYSATWAPVPYKDMLLNGSAGGEYGIRGFVEAVDIGTGQRRWRRWTTPKDLWIGDSWRHGASPNWMSVSVDVNTDTVYANIGNPGPDVSGIVRPGPNPYSTAVLALDAGSGSVNWYFQESPHDWWDYDAASTPVIFDAEVLGERRTIVSHAGKTGWLYSLDAENGDLYERSQEFCQHLNTWYLPQQTLEDTPWIMPSADGGSEWNPVSYSRNTGLVYVKAMNYPSKFQWDPNAEKNLPSQFLGGGFTVFPEMQDVTPPEEWSGLKTIFSAVDPISGEVVWQHSYEPYSIGGSMSTTTGLTFVGFGSGDFVAFDSATGERLWTHNFEASVNASPMSWYDPTTRKQYVAIQAGGGGLRSVTTGDEVAVFSMRR